MIFAVETLEVKVETKWLMRHEFPYVEHVIVLFMTFGLYYPACIPCTHLIFVICSSVRELEIRELGQAGSDET